jgi:hypothetical protein
MVKSSFRTVPLYREQWALVGRTDPEMVPGRVGVHSGAIQIAEAVRRVADLVPLGGGTTLVDATRGVGAVLAARDALRGNGVVVILDKAEVLPPTDLPRGVVGCVTDPTALSESTWLSVTNALRRNVTVVAIGTDKQLAELTAVLPDDLAPRLDLVPRRTIHELDSGPHGVLHDPALGYLGVLRQCGRWHLDRPRVYARETDAGLAFTLLRQHSPRFVDMLVGGAATLGRCPRHGTPVVLP